MAYNRVTFSVDVLPATKAAIKSLTDSAAIATTYGKVVDLLVERELGRDQTLAEESEVELLSAIGMVLASASAYQAHAAVKDAVKTSQGIIFNRLSALRQRRARVTLQNAEEARNAAPLVPGQPDTYDRELEYDALPDSAEAFCHDHHPGA